MSWSQNGNAVLLKTQGQNKAFHSTPKENFLIRVAPALPYSPGALTTSAISLNKQCNYSRTSTHRCAFSFTYNFWLLNTYGCSLDSCWTLEQKSIPCKNPFSANHPNESPWMEYGDGFWFLFMIQFIMISWKKWNFHTSWVNILNIWMTINRKLNH